MDKKKVLVFIDNQEVLSCIKPALEAGGFDVNIVTNRDEFEKAIRGKEYSVVLFDVLMPTMEKKVDLAELGVF